MALQTPRQPRQLQRPSFGTTNTASSPNLSASLNSSTAVNRKASLNALTGYQDPKTPGGRMDGDLEVGDLVNVPGDMYGTVKFVGSVRGKSGRFVGVELGREFAARGKNDGDVDGVSYFNTSVPGAGIFLPVHRAEKRSSPSLSLDSFPATPSTPSYGSSVNGHRNHDDSKYTPPTPAVPPKFSQSVGPGARPSSPSFKPKRPSLPRPESPLRKNYPTLAPTPARSAAAVQRGPRPVLPTTTPSKNNLRSSTTSRPSTSHSQAPRPYSRTGSRAGHRSDNIGEEEKTPVGRTPSVASVPPFSQPPRSSSRLGSAGGSDSEILRLRAEIAERDKRLAEQAASLSDMEASVKELSGLLPTDGPTPNSAKLMSFEGEDQNAAQLRQMLREKNEKITLLTSEFDAHRADFRSTLDSLEMASTETERVYEEQKRELIAQVEQMSERIQEMEDTDSSKKDVEDLARQMKGLEEFVQELEEGLEDARRGEAEARGEVEFLRGEVERCRSELKRERERSAAANGLGPSKESEQKDDEIRGLKAIIHSMSTASNGTGSGHNSFIKETDEVKRLQAALSDSNQEKEALEQQLEQIRRDTVSNGHARNESEMTATMSNSGANARSRANTVKATFAEHIRRAGMDNTLPTSDRRGEIYCEMCQSREHDMFDCTQFSNNHDTSTEGDDDLVERKVADSAGMPKILPLNPSKEDLRAAAKDSNNDKWCALCEKDGHLVYECPDEKI